MNAKGYEPVTLTFRDGEVVEGEVKILDQRNIKFKENKKKKKTEYNYIKVKEIKIKRGGETFIYKYKIIVGKRPLLLMVIKEYEGIINLYAAEYSKTYGDDLAPISLLLTDDFREYYVNKDSGDTVTKLGKSEQIFGSQHLKKNN
ncbi:hypothetical protein [Winogradskyella sp. UBA3174]|uniref:hypothetical protein n=1 Tax=Winogradskyella sp. UBA3174 TaxID=1947785 RepID=UPI0025F6E378|nr:hypothetical protein [Winogradskyella sp. UBA3174]